MPYRVYLLRGSHETKYCTSAYGFEQEVKIKYGDQGEYVYNKCLECFIELPLASVVASCVYTTHGGLFRKSIAPLLTYKRKRAQKLELGSLEDLSKIKRFLVDAPKGGQNILLTDVLWSDPSKENGLSENTYRGLALWWGPDCTDAFLKQSNLKVIYIMTLSLFVFLLSSYFLIFYALPSRILATVDLLEVSLSFLSLKGYCKITFECISNAIF